MEWNEYEDSSVLSAKIENFFHKRQQFEENGAKAGGCRLPTGRSGHNRNQPVNQGLFGLVVLNEDTV